MGTTSMSYRVCEHNDFTVKEAASFLDYIQDEFGSSRVMASHLHQGLQIDDFIKPHELYVLLKNNATGVQWMCVIKIEIYEREIYWKCMDEDQEPYYYNCPKILTDQLSETKNIRSLSWRNFCAIEQKKKSLDLEVPTRPVKF